MEAQDLDAAVAVSAAAFGVDVTDPATRERWRSRIAFPSDLDPEGMFVAERDGRVIGVAQALRRERLWCLSLLTIDPAAQSGGAGLRLTAYGALCVRGDPGPLRPFIPSGPFV